MHYIASTFINYVVVLQLCMYLLGLIQSGDNASFIKMQTVPADAHDNITIIKVEQTARYTQGVKKREFLSPIRL